MILGQPVSQDQRVRFDKRTRHANPGYVPGMIKTSFQTHLHPLQHVLPAMTGRFPRIGGMKEVQAQMAPGAPRHRQGLMPASEPVVAPAEVPSAPPVAAGTAGFGYSTFGAGGGGGHGRRMNPYMAMVTGAWPGVRSNARGIRQGAQQAGPMIKRLLPFQYPGGTPAGTYAALPAAVAGPVAAPISGYYW